MLKMIVTFDSGVAVKELPTLYGALNSLGGRAVFVPTKEKEATDRDAIATIVWDAIKEFDTKATVNVNDYAEQIIQYMLNKNGVDYETGLQTTRVKPPEKPRKKTICARFDNSCPLDNVDGITCHRNCKQYGPRKRLPKRQGEKVT